MVPLLNTFMTSCFVYDYIEKSEVLKGWEIRAINRKGMYKFKTRSTYMGIPVVSMNKAFKDFRGRRIDLSRMDTSNIVDARGAFMGVTLDDGLDFSMLNLENLVHTAQMFQVAKIPKIDMHGLYLPKMTDAWEMFDYVTASEINLSGAHGNVIGTADYMFKGCKHIEQLDLRGFTFSDINCKMDMFEYTPKLQLLLMKDEVFAPELERDYGFKVIKTKVKDSSDLEKIKAKAKLLGISRLCLVCA